MDRFEWLVSHDPDMNYKGLSLLDKIYRYNVFAGKCSKPSHKKRCMFLLELMIKLIKEDKEKPWYDQATTRAKYEGM